MPQLPTLTNPCSQSRENLQPDGDGLYCTHCRTAVTDFTGMTDGELADWLRRYPRGCGIFRPDQLHSATDPPPRRRLRTAVHWLLGALLCCLGWPRPGGAQRPIRGREVQIPSGNPWHRSDSGYRRPVYQEEFRGNRTGGYVPGDELGIGGGLNDDPDTLHRSPAPAGRPGRR